MLQGLDPVLKEAKPDVVLVHGDTLTTFLASYAAFMQQIKVGHVEAGLRTWNKLSPYPEEMNRQLTGRSGRYAFRPTDWSAGNLRKENKSEEHIYITGNTVTDVFQYTVKRISLIRSGMGEGQAADPDDRAQAGIQGDRIVRFSGSQADRRRVRGYRHRLSGPSKSGRARAGAGDAGRSSADQADRSAGRR